jgi:hypothetical protein
MSNLSNKIAPTFNKAILAMRGSLPKQQLTLESTEQLIQIAIDATADRDQNRDAQPRYNNPVVLIDNTDETGFVTGVVNFKPHPIRSNEAVVVIVEGRAVWVGEGTTLKIG